MRETGKTCIITIQDHFFIILSGPKAAQKEYVMCKLPFMSENLCCESAEMFQKQIGKQVSWLCDCARSKKKKNILQNNY